MKKILIIILAIMALVSMSGCTKEEIETWDNIIDIFRKDKTEELPCVLEEFEIPSDI